MFHHYLYTCTNPECPEEGVSLTLRLPGPRREVLPRIACPICRTLAQRAGFWQEPIPRRSRLRDALHRLAHALRWNRGQVVSVSSTHVGFRCDGCGEIDGVTEAILPRFLGGKGSAREE